MKSLIFSLIMLVLACNTTFSASAASVSKQVVKQNVAKNKVYYVVVQSFSSLAGAKEFLVKCPDALDGPVYETTVKGKKLYRVCVACYNKKSDAVENARMINELMSIGAWVWPNNGLAKCVYNGVALNGEPHDLNPR